EKYYASKYDLYKRMHDTLRSDGHIYRNLNSVRKFLDDFSNDIELYLVIIDKESFSDQEKSFLLNLVFKNYHEVIKKLYHKLYEIAVSDHKHDLYKEMSLFFLEAYRSKKDFLDPFFSNLSEPEKKQIIKEEKKEAIAHNIFTLQFILEKLGWIKEIENKYEIGRDNLFFANK